MISETAFVLGDATPTFSLMFWVIVILTVVLIMLYVAFKDLTIALVPLIGVIIFMSISGLLDGWILYLILILVVIGFSYIVMVPLFTTGGK